MIPKIIHYCWFGGNPLPDDVKKYIATWKQYCPDYEIKQWNEDNFNVAENRYCRETYEARKWAFVSDYARLKILYEHGGIYMDTDVEVVKNLDSVLKYRAFGGFESKHTISTGVIGSCMENEWIEILLKDYEDRCFIRNDGMYDLTTNVVRVTELTKRTYNVRMNNTMQRFGDQMILFPFDYLCAKSFETGKIHQTNNTLTVHHFTGSWLMNDERLYLQMLQQYQKAWPRVFQYSGGRTAIKVVVALRSGGISLLKRKLKRKI